MPTPNLIILYVEDTIASAAFYRKLLGIEPHAEFPGYSSFQMDTGLTLGLLAKTSTAVVPSAAGDRTELAFMVKADDDVTAQYEDWKTKGLTIVQDLTRFEFGPSFVALDPDGHRLRVCLYDD
ncbi:VOC family protein [Pararhizobium sp.]|uniref:VOC family protein n=1 Tax=Pararhizobium sp. TaxID=1977563 RepID=UPI0027239C4B|nr:VOC family protein [Pararhizobium sp.]MDO9417649.1 VOC family protein [Pararhizobium sp.]